jgi:hypothetical protein
MPYRLVDVVANCMIGISREPSTENGTPAKLRSKNLPNIRQAACSEEPTNTEITSRRGEMERQGHTKERGEALLEIVHIPTVSVILATNS